MHALGRHILVEFYDCDEEALNACEFLEKHMVEAARRSKATVISSSCHQFNPFGVSGVVVIAESHITIHTWPEHRYAAVDIFTCGETVDPWLIQDYLKEKLQSGHVSSMELKRGMFSHPVNFKPVEG